MPPCTSLITSVAPLLLVAAAITGACTDDEPLVAGEGTWNVLLTQSSGNCDFTTVYGGTWPVQLVVIENGNGRHTIYSSNDDFDVGATLACTFTSCSLTAQMQDADNLFWEQLSIDLALTLSKQDAISGTADVLSSNGCSAAMTASGQRTDQPPIES
jgi:hypothetical protein